LINNGHAVGIDFGTSNTVALIRRPDGRTRPVLFDGQPILASAVYLDPRGLIHAGQDAQRMAQVDPARYEPNPKRRIDEGRVLLGDREVPVVDLLAAPLARVAQAVREAVGHLPPAVLACPVAWGQARRGTLLDAAARAGWRGTELVFEPLAAAKYLTVAKPIPAGGVLAVFDLGGGTLDVALVGNHNGRLTVVGTGGSENLGGVDFDAALVGHLGDLLAQRHPAVWAQITQPVDALARRHRAAFWDDVRVAKEMLSRSTVAPVPIPGVDAALHLTRDELEQVALPLVHHAVAEFESTLDRAGLTRQALSGVFLVGGASRVPLVSRLLHTRLGLAPTVPDQPELPVAEGALLVSARSVTTPASPPRSPALVPAAPPFAADPRAAPAAVAPTPYAAPGSQRAPRRGRWRPLAIVLVAVFVLMATIGGVVYNALKPKPSFQAAAVERVTRIENLKPDGLRRSLLSETKAYAVGEQADGTLTVVTVDLATGAEIRHQPAKASGWERAELFGNWVVATSVPGRDGGVTVAFANGSDDIVASQALKQGDRLVQRFAGPDTKELDLFVISEATSTIRTIKIAREGVQRGETHQLPAKMRPANRAGPEPGLNLLIDLVGDDGTLYKYSGIAAPEEDDRREPLPKGISPALFYVTGTGDVWVAEDKLDYRVSLGSGLDLRGPADRRPVWIGPCGRRQDAALLDDYYTCVVDEVPDQPASRQLAVYREGVEPVRAQVPHAQPDDGLVETGGYLLVPTAEEDRTGYVTVAPDGRTHTYSGRLWVTGYQAVIHVPTVTSGTAVTAVTGVDLGDDLRTVVGSPDVRSAGCSGAENRLACPGPEDYTVWVVGTKDL
jgi:Hsp70 protein